MMSMPILKYLTLNSNVADLGIYLNKFYSISRGNISNAFYGHFSPILLLFAPIFKLSGEYPIYFILLFQSLSIFIPSLYFYKKFNWFYGVIYLLTPTLWFVLLFDFHIDVIIIPLSLFFFHYLDKKNYKNCFIISFLFILIKEIYILTSLFSILIILWELINNNNKNQKYKSYIIISIFFLIFYFILFYFINQHFLPSIGNNNFLDTDHLKLAYSYLGSSFFEIFIGIFTNLHLIIIDILSSKEKLKYLFVILLPFYFLGFLNFKYLVLGFPAIFIILISKNTIYIDHTNHYVSGFIIPIFYSFIKSIEELKNKSIFLRKSSLLIFSIVIHFLISPSPVSRLFFSDKIERFNMKNYILNDDIKNKKTFLKNYDFKNNLISIQNNIAYFDLFKTENILIFPEGIFEEVKKPKFENFELKTKSHFLIADYIIVDTSRDKFIKDVGCHFVRNECTDKIHEKNYEKIIMYLKQNKKYKKIYHQEGFMVYKLIHN